MHTEIALQPLQPPIHYIRLQDDPPAAKESGQTRSAFIIKDNSSVVTLDLKFTLLTVTLSYSLSLKRCGSKQQMMVQRTTEKARKAARRGIVHLQSPNETRSIGP